MTLAVINSTLFILGSSMFAVSTLTNLNIARNNERTVILLVTKSSKTHTQLARPALCSG